MTEKKIAPKEPKIIPSKVLAYIRVSTNKQDVNNQRLVIQTHADIKKMKVKEFIEVQSSAIKTRKQRKIDEVLSKLSGGDTLIVTELSRLGRTIPEITGLVYEILEMNVRLISLKENLDVNTHNKYDIASRITVTIFSLLAELARHLASQRTKEGLATRKANGKILGKPRGTIQKSKFDKYAGKIALLVEYGVSGRRIAKNLECKPGSLNAYIKSRNLRVQR